MGWERCLSILLVLLRESEHIYKVRSPIIMLMCFSVCKVASMTNIDNMSITSPFHLAFLTFHKKAPTNILPFTDDEMVAQKCQFVHR